MDEFSPSEYYRGGGCIHANDKGYAEVFKAHWDLFLQHHL